MFGLSIGFQNGMSWSHSTKTHKVVWIHGNGPFPDQGPGGAAHGAGSPTQQYNYLVSKPWKFQFISCSRSKVIPFFLPDRHTDAHFASLYAQESFFCMEIYTFNYTTFLHLLCSLTLFVTDKWLIYTPENRPIIIVVRRVSGLSDNFNLKGIFYFISPCITELNFQCTSKHLSGNKCPTTGSFSRSTKS